MFHTAVYSASIANGTVLLQVAAIADPFMATSGNGLLVNGDAPFLWKIAGVGTNLTRVQLTSATLRDYAPFDIGPVNVGTAIESPARTADLRPGMIQLATNEELDVFGVQSNAGAQRITVAVWMGDSPPRTDQRRVFTMHWTASTTLTANAFTQFQPVFDNGLPSGTFAIVGSRAISAGGLVHRFIPKGRQAARPGGLMVQAQDGYPLDGSRYSDPIDNWGEWMRFTNTTIPLVEVFSGTADTTEEGYIDMVQVA